MYVVLAWFSDGPLPPGAADRALARFDRALAPLLPDTYARHDSGGGDWGLSVRFLPDTGYRWPVVAAAGGVTAVSLGLPVGVGAADPVGLGRRLLAGEDVHAEVVPPFGLLAVERPAAGPDRFAVQQDWLGMCRLFTGHAGGVTAFASRPSLLAEFLTGEVGPDPEGWTAYAVSGHFGADTSPVRGVRLLGPGVRVTGRRRAAGGWAPETAHRYAVDDVVLAGLEARGGGIDAVLDGAADVLARTAANLADIYPDNVTLGLSGGKDSRLIAASFLAAGRLPDLVTNDDLAAEGDVARRLVEVVGRTRGLRPSHRVVPAAAPAAVLTVGLRDRVRRMQRLYDYQFPSTFTVRPAGPDRLPARARPASITGGAGGLAVGCWYPRDPGSDDDRAAAERVALNRLAAVPPGAVEPGALARERDRARRILAHAAALGLVGVELIDYLYLVERGRRWHTSANHPGMVTPFLAPRFLAAAFTLSPAQKRAWALHHGLLRRLAPEWADVPFVANSPSTSRATRVWEGDGLAVICELLDTAGGSLPALLRREAVAAAAGRSRRGQGTGQNQKVLQQYVWLALAAQELEPGTVRRPAPAGTGPYARLGRPSAAPRLALSAVAARLRFVRRYRLGRRIWAAARDRATRR